MNLACPKCGAEDTKKLSLIMNGGGTTEKIAQLGMTNFYNLTIPILTVIFACMFGFMFALSHPVMGFLVFVGILFVGFKLRSRMKAKTRSNFADLAPQMKRDGFQCGRCANLFIPGGASA